MATLARAALPQWRRLLQRQSRALTLAASLLLLMTCVLFTADLMGLRGDSSDEQRQSRKVIAESLAVQLTTLASLDDKPGLSHAVAQFVKRNPQVVAATLTTEEGRIDTSYGDATLDANGLSTAADTEVLVPIFNRDEQWGEVRVLFGPLAGRWQELRYFGFVLLAGFVAVALFLRRALVQLDPSSVVPERVNTAFNLFTEGVLILDDELRILLANEAAARLSDRSAQQLIGQRLDDWPWQRGNDQPTPWAMALNTGRNIADRPMQLMAGTLRDFMVSTALVEDNHGNLRGVMVTLDDLTEIERKNRELSQTLRQLRQSEESIKLQNRELEALATLDPLTGLKNRRALLTSLDSEHAQMQRHGNPLSCIMVDIDHFKRINDNHGHRVGDEVICAVANTLLKECREYDTVGRYGGEEFVVILPHATVDEAAVVAERIRRHVESLGADVTVPVEALSASLGVAQMDASESIAANMVDQADQALYVAKESGRNQVILYDREQIESHETSRAATQIDQQASEARVTDLEAVVDQQNRDLEQMRDFDELTGAPTRKLFIERVESEVQRAQRYKTRIGVLSLEIKDVPLLMASFGHAACDALVVEFVAAVQEVLRRTDLVCEISSEHNISRLTANDYAIVLTDLEETGHAMPVITRLRRLLARPFSVDGHAVYLGANMGISLYPKGGDKAMELIESAVRARDTAAREPAKVAHSFASASLDQVSRDYIQLEADLFRAVRHEEFEVFFQPKFDIVKRRICGLEALIRWKHAQRGYISPVDFIPVAEANGLINEISALVLRQTLQRLARWNELGFDDLRISINISPTQLRDPQLVSNILGDVEKAGMSTAQLDIELTETSVIESPQRARIALGQLRDAGLRVSMDDFGTGYTSLALLAELPLDSVKIDRSFIDAMATNERSRAIVESVISMAHALKLWVVGEGVETREQLHTLTRLGCNEIQGYLISRPLPADEITLLLEQQRDGELSINDD